FAREGSTRPGMRALLALAWLLACSLRAAADAPPRPHVYLVIVDGLAARVADAAHMPRLFEAVAHEPAHSSLFPDAHAVLLARLFAGVPARQRAPDMLWSPERLPPARRDPASGYAPDAETMGAVLALAAAAEPDLAVLNLSDVDRTGHARGPDGPEYVRAVAGADAAVGRLLDELHARGRWDRPVVI